MPSRGPLLLGWTVSRYVVLSWPDNSAREMLAFESLSETLGGSCTPRPHQYNHAAVEVGGHSWHAGHPGAVAGDAARERRGRRGSEPAGAAAPYRRRRP